MTNCLAYRFNSFRRVTIGKATCLGSFLCELFIHRNMNIFSMIYFLLLSSRHCLFDIALRKVIKKFEMVEVTSCWILTILKMINLISMSYTMAIEVSAITISCLLLERTSNKSSFTLFSHLKSYDSILSHRKPFILYFLCELLIRNCMESTETVNF